MQAGRVSLAVGRIVGRVLWAQEKGCPCTRKAVPFCWDLDGNLGLLAMPLLMAVVGDSREMHTSPNGGTWWQPRRQAQAGV